MVGAQCIFMEERKNPKVAHVPFPEGVHRALASSLLQHFRNSSTDEWKNDWTERGFWDQYGLWSLWVHKKAASMAGWVLEGFTVIIIGVHPLKDQIPLPSFPQSLPCLTVMFVWSQQVHRWQPVLQTVKCGPYVVAFYSCFILYCRDSAWM